MTDVEIICRLMALRELDIETIGESLNLDEHYVGKGYHGRAKKSGAYLQIARQIGVFDEFIAMIEELSRNNGVKLWAATKEQEATLMSDKQVASIIFAMEITNLHPSYNELYIVARQIHTSTSFTMDQSVKTVCEHYKRMLDASISEESKQLLLSTLGGE
jgi:hypothetical protein